MDIQILLSKLSKVKESGGGWKALCPAHEDHTPSLSIGHTDDGKVLIKCQAGCRTEDVTIALGLKLSDLFPERAANLKNQNGHWEKSRTSNGTHPSMEKTQNKKSRWKGDHVYRIGRDHRAITCVFRFEPTYDDEDYFELCRFERKRDHEPKELPRMRDCNDNAFWLGKAPDAEQRPLFNQAALEHATTIHITEGPKDTQSLNALGFVATCVAFNSNLRLRDLNLMEGKCIVLWGDNDNAGRQKVDSRIRELSELALSIKVPDMSSFAEKTDVTDLIEKHRYSKQMLEQMIEAAPEKVAGENLTDMGNAKVFIRLMGDQVRYDTTSGRFLLWDGHTWRWDMKGEIYELARAAVRQRLTESILISDNSDREKAVKHALKSENTKQIDALIKQVKSMGKIPVISSELDTNPMLVGTPNGTVDVTAGESRIGKPQDLITMRTGIRYDPQATCSRWDKFLREVFEEDEELIEFVRRAVGYSLTGRTNEQALFILTGGGENGKSVFLSTLSFVIGDYAHTAPFSTFVVSRNDRIPNDMAALVSKRLVIAAEVNEYMVLDESRLKAMTGEDKIAARFLHREWFQFQPTFKLWLAVNRLPGVRDFTHAFWRRIRVIPFNRTFTGKERDSMLPQKLRKEAAGILRWAVEGCLKWEEGGLGIPKSVEQATLIYQTDQDVFRRFLDECTIGCQEAKVRSQDLYKVYKSWCEERGEFVQSMRWVGLRMRELGYHKTDQSPVTYRGIGLKNNDRETP